MANPFQDQFLKAGLTDKTKVEKAKRKQRKNTNQKNRKEVDQLNDDQKRLLAESDQKAAKDRELNERKHQQSKQNEIAAQIKQLIEMNSIQPKKDGEPEPFQFNHDGKIKQIDLDTRGRAQLISGVLCVALLGEKYHLIPRRVADKVSERDDSYIVLANSMDASEAAEDDEYADFPVPDDLVW